MFFGAINLELQDCSVKRVKMEEKRGCIDPQSKVRYKKKRLRVDFAAVPASGDVLKF